MFGRYLLATIERRSHGGFHRLIDAIQYSNNLIAKVSDQCHFVVSLRFQSALHWR
jgi:hypothetical protein